MDWQSLIDALSNFGWLWFPTALQILGTVVIVATAVDTMLTKIDFMNKVFEVPVLGSFLKFVVKFSPLNFKDPK